MHTLLLTYALYAHRHTDEPITQLALFSERSSGSNYVQRLIEVNSPLQRNESCMKHFPPWFQLPIDDYYGPRHHYTFEGTDNTLFVIIFRDPYDWVRSLHLQPYFVAPLIQNLSFSAFIRMPWILDRFDPIIAQERSWNPRIDLDPQTGFSFDNVFKLRTAKIETMLLIKERAKNVYYINYESARDHPQEVLAELSSFFHFPLYDTYTPRLLYKNQLGVPYAPKVYDPISDKDLLYINSQLDESLENSIGYQLHQE